MTTRVCSPPSMDITRDINPTSGSLPVSSATQSTSPSNPLMFSSSTTGHSGRTEFTLTLRSNVARSLFGPPDPRSGQYAREKVKEIREKDKEKWNFDFDNEKPLEGRYKWEQVAACVTSGSSTAAQIPKAYAFSRMPYIYNQSATSAETTSGNIEGNNFDRDSLLIVRAVDQERTSTASFSASTSTCPPPTPVKSSPEHRASFSPDRLQQQVSNNPSSSSLSSQSSPECSMDLIDPTRSIPSPPSSLEECSSPSPSLEDNKSCQESTEGKPLDAKVMRSKKTSQPPITKFTKSRKRSALTQSTTSPSAEKKAAL